MSAKPDPLVAAKYLLLDALDEVSVRNSTQAQRLRGVIALLTEIDRELHRKAKT